MNNKNRMTKTAGRLGRIIIFALVFALVSVVSITACACGVQAYADSTDSVRIVSDLASAGTATIDVSGNVSLPDLVYVNGTKTLKGNGTLQGTSSDYIIVVNSGASLTLEGVTVSGEGISGNGIYVSEDAAFVMKSGSVQSVKGVGVRVLGKASFNGGSISKAGENWLMLDTGASADVSALECTEAGAIGIITADGSSLTLGSGVSLTGSKGNLVYNGGKAAISGSSFGDAEDYAIHNDGELKISGTDFSGSKFLGYLENAETGDCTIEKSSMENSKADFIYNFGKLGLVNVEFDNCTSTAIESRGSKSEITVKDCKMDNIGKTAFLCKNGTLTIDKLEIAKCGGNGIHSRGCEVNGKDITIKECGAIGFLNDFPSDNDEAGVKSFTVDGFEIGHCVSYAIRSNGEYVINDSDYGTTSTGTVKSVKADEKTADTAADKTAAASDEDDAAEVAEDDEEDEIKIDSIHDDDKTAEDTENVKEQDKDKDGKADKPHMTLSNGKVGKSDSYGLYVKGGDVILNNVKFLGTNDIGRAVIQVGYSKTPGGRLTLNEVDTTGGKRGITNYSTLIMNSGNIHGNCIDNTSTSTGAGVYNAGTFIMNGGMIYGNACANSGGGVSNAKDAHFDMYGGIITQNTSGGYGGGVTNSGYFNLYNGTISKNISAKGGGGVRNACVAGLYGGVIKENKSEKSGGGLYCSTSDTCVSGVIIRDNTAGNYGGGIYNAGKMTVQGTASINANFAENNGAGIYNTGNTTMTSGRITGNTDGNKNCAIYLSSGEFTLTGGEVDSPAGDKFDVYLFGGTMNISGSPNIDKIKRRNTLYTNSDGKVFEIPTFNVAGALDVPVGSINLALSLKEGNPALNGDKNLISEYYDRFSLLNSKGVKLKNSTYFINHDVKSEMCGYIDSETVAYVGDTKYSWEGALAAVGDSDPIEIYRSFTVNDSAIDKNVIVTKHDSAGADCTITIDDDDSGDYAVTVKNSAAVTFKSININGGSRSAAAFYVASGSLTFDDCNLSGMNSSGNQGAAILVNTDGTLNLINGSIKNCYSAGSGAAVYNKGKTNVEGTIMSGNSCEPSKSGIVNGKDINNYNKSTLSLKNVTADDICLSNDATIEGKNIIKRVFLYNISGGTNSVLIAKDSLAGSDIKIDVVEGQGSYPNLFVPGTVVVKADGEEKLTAETLSVFSLINNTDAKKVGDKFLIVLTLKENDTQGQLAINPELSEAILFSGRGTNHVNDKGEIVSNAVIATDGTIGDVLAKAAAQTEECTVYIAKPVTYDADFTVESNKTIDFYGNISSSLSFDSKKLTVNGESHFNGIEILPHDDETTIIDNGHLCMSGINICSVQLAPEKYITLDSSLSDGACVSVKVSNDYYVPGTRILSGSGVAESCSYIKMLNEPADKYTVGTDGCLGGDEATLFNADGEAVKSGDIDELIIEAQDGYSIKLLRKNVTIDGKAMVGGEEKAIESTTIGENKGITFSGADSTYKITLGADISTSSTLYFKTITFTGKDADKQQHTVKLAGAEGRLYGNGGTVNFIDVAVDGCSDSVILNHAPIYLSSTTSFNMTGGIVKNTYVIVSGGAISNSGISVLNGVTFDSCKAMKDGTEGASTKYGGAIYNTQDITLNNCSFSGCVAEGYGGAVYNKGTATISGGSIKNSGYTGNTFVTTRGGAVCNTSMLTIKDGAELSGNQATNGGAIYNNGGTVEISGGKYESNNAKDGGAFYNNGGTLTATSSHFYSNSTTKESSYGGGVAYNSGTATFTNCTIGSAGKGNTSSKQGGAFYVNSKGTLTISGGTISYSTSDKEGGAIYNGNILTINNSAALSNNTSTTNGGAIFSKKTINVSSCTFENNTASVGGAIYNENANGTATVSSTKFYLNTTTGSSLGGGAIYNSGTINLTDSDVGAQYKINTSAQGGGIYNVGTLAVSGGKVYYNEATSSNGGGVYNEGTLSVTGAIIKYNKAKNGSGGAIYNSGSIILSGSNTISNSMKNDKKYGIDIYSNGTILASGTQTIGELYIANDKFISVNGALTGTNSIGIRLSSKAFSDGTVIVNRTDDATDENLVKALGAMKLLNGDYLVLKAEDNTETNKKEGVIRFPDTAEAALYKGTTLKDSGSLTDMLSSTSGDTVCVLKECTISEDDLSITAKAVYGEKITVTNDKVLSVADDALLKNIEISADSGKNAVTLTGTKLCVGQYTVISQVYLAEGQTICATETITEETGKMIGVKVADGQFKAGTVILTSDAATGGDDIIMNSVSSIELLDNAALEEDDRLLLDVTGKLRKTDEAKIVSTTDGTEIKAGALTDMIADVAENQKIVLMKSTISLDETLTVNKTAVIEGAATQKIIGNISIDTNGDLTIKGFTVDGTVINSGKLSINSVTVSGSTETTGVVTNSGTLTVDGATIKTLTETSGTVTVQNSASVTTLNQNGGALAVDGSGTTVTTLTNGTSAGTITFSNTPTVVNAIMRGTDLDYSALTGLENVTLGTGKFIYLTTTPCTVTCVTMDDFVLNRQVIKAKDSSVVDLLASSAYFTIGNDNPNNYIIGTGGKVMELPVAERIHDGNRTKLGSLSDILKEVTANDTIKILKPATNNNAFNSTNKVAYSINLNSKQLSMNGAGSLNRAVTLTGGTFNGNNKTIKINNSNGTIKTTEAVTVKDLTLESGNYKTEHLFNAVSGTLTLNNITASNITGQDSNGVVLYSSGGSIIFNSGTIGISTDGGKSTVFSYQGSISIKGGIVNGKIGCNSTTGHVAISSGTVNAELSGKKASTAGEAGFTITGGRFKKSNYDTKAELEAFIDTTAYHIEENGDYYEVKEGATPPTVKSFGASAPVYFTTPDAVLDGLNKCMTEASTKLYVRRLIATVDQLDELYNYVMNNIEAIEPPEGVDRGTRQYQLLNMIYDVKFSKGEGLYNALFTYENQQDYLNTLTVKELAVLRAWVDAKQIEIGLSENDLFNLKALIDGTPYANIDNEAYLNKLDTDELQDLRNYIIANNSEGDKTSDAGIDMTNKVDAVVEKKAAENLAKLEEAGTVKETVSTENEGETELTEEQKAAAAEEAKLKATKDAWAAAQKYISSLSEEELKALGLYIDKLQTDAYKAAQDAESAKTESDSAAVGEEATEEAKSAAAEKAKAAEEAAKAAEEAKKAAEFAEVYEDAVAVAKAEKVIGNAKEGEFFADEVLTVLLSKETAAERFEVIKGYTLENMNKLLEVIIKYDTTDFTEEERVVFEAVENLVRARIVELTPVNNDPA